METSDLATSMVALSISDQVIVTQFAESSFHERAGSLAYFSAFDSRYSGVIIADMPMDKSFANLTLYLAFGHFDFIDLG